MIIVGRWDLLLVADTSGALVQAKEVPTGGGEDTTGRSWSLGVTAETLRQGIGITSNTFPEH